MTIEAHDKPRRRLTFRRVSVERLEDHNAPVVFCPRRLMVTPVEKCRDCPRFSGLCVNPSEGDAFLRCSFGDDEPVRLDQGQEGCSMFPLSAAHAPVAEIMSAPVHCIRKHARLQEITALFLSEQVGALPVITDDGRPIGIVSKTDVMARSQEHVEDLGLGAVSSWLDRAVCETPALDSTTTAADIMTHAVFSIGQSVSVSRVAALMAYERVHHILVLAPDGRVAGIVSSLDIARWVARADGYVVPRRRRDASEH